MNKEEWKQLGELLPRELFVKIRTLDFAHSTAWSFLVDRGLCSEYNARYTERIANLRDRVKNGKNSISKASSDAEGSKSS